MKKLLFAALLVPAVVFAQASDSASRIKKKEASTAAPVANIIEFTPYTELPPEPAPTAHACVQPPVAKAFATQIEADQFNDALNNFQACMKNYVTVHTAAANAHADVANKAVAEANAYITEINTKFATDKDKK